MNMRRIATLLFFLTLAAATWAQDFKIDKAHSEVGFGVKHLMISTVKGRFTDFEGTVH